MKDDEYFGFSKPGDFNEVNLPVDNGSENDFEMLDLVDFDNENDVRIVRLSDVDRFHNSAIEQDEGCCWLDSGDRGKPKKTFMLPSFSAFKSGFAGKRHIVKSAIVAVLVVTVLLVFAGNALMGARPGVQSSTATAAQPVPMAPIMEPPVHEAPLIIDANHFYIQVNPNWMQVLLDGRSLQNVPIPGVDPPLLIANGQHLVMWRINSHQTYSCTMSVPLSLLDTCAYDGPESLQNGVAVWIIAFPHLDDGNS